jgi:calcineurin-like phosphoesterase
LREELQLDAVVVNAENSAPAGRGITHESGSALLSVADFLTLGNHAFDAEGYREFLEREHRVVRPANFGEKDPGLGWGRFEAGGVTVGVTNVLGRVFVERTKMSPFEAAGRAIAELGNGAQTYYSSIRTPRPRARSWRSAIISTAGRRPCSGPTRTCPRRISSSCPVERRT